MTYDNTMNGTIHTTASGLDIFFKNGKYYVTDDHNFNIFYLCNWNKREKLFEFYARNDVQFMGYKDFINAFQKHFKKKPVIWG